MLQSMYRHVPSCRQIHTIGIVWPALIRRAGIVRVKSVSWLVVNNGVRATGATAVAIFDNGSQAATGAHSMCTIIGPSVRTQSKADWFVTSPTAIPCGNRFLESAVDSAKGLPGGSPSREGAVQPEMKPTAAKNRKERASGLIMPMDLPETERCVKHRMHDSSRANPVDNEPFRSAYYDLACGEWNARSDLSHPRLPSQSLCSGRHPQHLPEHIS